MIELGVIPDEERRSEKELWHEFGRVRGQILGKLLDMVSHAIRNEENVSRSSLPRMADFIIWATAAEGGAPWPAGTAIAAYAANVQRANLIAIESNPVAGTLLQWARRISLPWKGTVSELGQELLENTPMDQMDTRTWPQTPEAFSHLLRRLAPNLREEGLSISFETRESRRRLVEIRRV